MRPDTANIPDFAALCPSAGAGRKDGEPLLTPIVQSTTFCREGVESEAQHRYGRESNPTVAVLEEVLGTLENAPPAVCFATGLAAEAALFFTLLKHGDRLVCSRALYGGTTRLAEQLLTQLGIQVEFTDTSDLDALQRTLRGGAALLLLETPANPTLDLVDLPAAVRLGHEAGALVAVDNTFMTPVLQQPLEHGADISVYSTTKFIDGHSAALGGALVARDDSLLERFRFVRKCTGGIQTPFHAWLTLQGIKTLPLRMERQSATAAALAARLADHPEVSAVHYPGLKSSAIADQQHLGAHGAVVSFEANGGYEAACRLLREVKVCRLVEHVGATETLLTHSASMTHGGVEPAARAAAGVTEGLVRISVGLEPLETIWSDLAHGLRTEASQAVTA